MVFSTKIQKYALKAQAWIVFFARGCQFLSEKWQIPQNGTFFATITQND
jgi:hypothetical protein